jgi:hypothetical protein
MRKGILEPMRAQIGIVLALTLVACSEDNVLDGSSGVEVGIIQDTGVRLDASDSGPSDSATDAAADSGIWPDATFDDATILDAVVQDDAEVDAGPADLGVADTGAGDTGIRTPTGGPCIISGGNTCDDDRDCFVGGCGGEYCGEEGVITTCNCFPPGLGCGCVNGMCTWYQ